MVAAVRVTAPCAHHGEGPFWDGVTGRLLFVDMLAGAVLRWDPRGDGVTRHPVGTVAAVVRRRARGGFVLALERGFALADEDLRVVETLPAAVTDDGVRLNDGGCDPQGRFYAGSMAYAMTSGAGSLYRLDPGRRVHRVLDGVTISNGIQWSRDGATVFYSDTATGRVDAFDFDGATGAFAGRRPFVVIDPAVGAPDGVAIDEEDGLWVALWGGWAVHRYDARGTLTEVVALPVPNVTACALGGPDGRTLYITTSREGLAAGEFPEAGAIFAAAVGVRGGIQHAYGG